ncbi:MAG TPA: hypothetical protein VF169_24065 [Albitalea sp.]|uniref:hypothetical protein n=1 Tax=Piscinibacter sp. TaxID=1903157 RepID=UPI002ED190D6
MLLNECHEGDYRIWAGALGGELGDGYIAAVVIDRVRGLSAGPREAFRDESLAGGYRWPSPQAAVWYAINKGRELVTAKRDRLAC